MSEGDSPDRVQGFDGLPRDCGSGDRGLGRIKEKYYGLQPTIV